MHLPPIPLFCFWLALDVTTSSRIQCGSWCCFARPHRIETYFVPAASTGHWHCIPFRAVRTSTYNLSPLQRHWSIVVVCCNRFGDRVMCMCDGLFCNCRALLELDLKRLLQLCNVPSDFVWGDLLKDLPQEGLMPNFSRYLV